MTWLRFGNASSFLVKFGEKDRFRAGFVRLLIDTSRFDDRHETMLGDPRGRIELLRYHGGDPVFGGAVDHGAHLGAEDTEPRGSGQNRIEFRHRFHQADTVPLGLKPLVDIHKGDDASLFPQDAGVGFPRTTPSIVPSKRIAAITLAPVKAGAVMMRARI
jgi:hypothetical protein